MTMYILKISWKHSIKSVNILKDKLKKIFIIMR